MQDEEPGEPGAQRRRIDSATSSSLVQTIAIVAAGAWAVYTFVYEARIKPSLAPPAVSVTTNLTKAGEKDDKIAIRSTVTRTNVGQTGVRVLGLTYNVVGIRARFEPKRPDALATHLAQRSVVDEARDYVLSDPGEVILRQGVLFAGAADGPAPASDLNPGEAVSRDLIVYADRSKFDSIRFKVGLAYGKIDETPVPLRFASDQGDEIAVVPKADCATDAAVCQRLKTTDFATEFSLW
ncbi:MAG: hypothetical protein K2Y56_09460 [Methylobacterium sp.]|uniref:hypothetical protein n=1 Tax=Methylobacterium sp. TaxID=409 RepID=UPI0025EF7E65|nr:hypothetical protein [Methylobacterium sp.]MBX9931747.1 hypothetical protein [Methylobacterium sp.]